MVRLHDQNASVREGSPMKSVKSWLRSLLPQGIVLHLQAIDHFVNGEREIRLLRNLVDRKKRAIDAGANIGTYSYFLRKYAVVVYAYEPNPELAARLSALLPDVKVRPVALSEEPGELTFSVPIDASGRPQHELGSVAQDFTGNVRRVLVQCVTIDSESVDNVGFIKIDVEQHEREVLRGGLKTIEKFRPVLLVEVYPLKYKQSLEDEFAFILRMNYCAWFFFSGHWNPLDSFERHVHAAPMNFGKSGKFMGNNLIFFPKEHPRAAMGPVERR